MLHFDTNSRHKYSKVYYLLNHTTECKRQSGSQMRRYFFHYFGVVTWDSTWMQMCTQLNILQWLSQIFKVQSSVCWHSYRFTSMLQIIYLLAFPTPTFQIIPKHFYRTKLKVRNLRTILFLPGCPAKFQLWEVEEILHTQPGSELALILYLTKEKYL